MAASPLREEIHRRLEQVLRNFLFPETRFHRKRTEKSDASPSGCEVGSDQFAIDLSRQCCLWGRSEASVCEVGVAPYRHWVGQPKEGAKRQPYDAVSFGKIALYHWADLDIHYHSPDRI
jgi:hypothetical protein